MPDFIDRFGEPIGPNGEMKLSSSRQSIITSLLSAGTFVFVATLEPRGTHRTDQCCSGALGQAFTSDRFGRRGSIRIWSVSVGRRSLPRETHLTIRSLTR